MALTAKKVYAILKRQISDMEAKLNSPIRYRGTVATADLLPLNPDIGDMYNIESKSVYGEAGMNVAWNGVVWDTMGAPIDMSLYIKSSELADWVKQQNKPTYTAEEVGALPADTKIPSKTSDLQNDSGFLTKIPDNYLSGTDKTLSVSGKAADAKATGEKFTEMSADISKKLDKNQGSENSGKIAGINEAGDIVPMFPMGVEYNSETNCLEFGSDQKMKLNQGIGLDSTLTKTGFAADAGVTGKEISSLKESISNKITKFYASSQGETHLADSDNGKIMDMMVYGKSEQKQYSGKNLFTFQDGSRIINGITFEAKDGIITAKGTATEVYTSTFFQFDYPKDIFAIGETYTFSINSNDNNLKLYALYKANDTSDYRALFNFTTKTATVRIPENVDLLIRCVVNINTTVNATATIQIEKGSEATSYEPYTGGQPSPSPDYPQEIKSVANPTMKVCGKNLIADGWLKDVVHEGYSLTVDGTKMVLNGSAASIMSEYGTYFTLPKGTYTFSAMSDTEININVYVRGFKKDDSTEFTATISETNKSLQFTVGDETDKLVISEGFYGGVTYTNTEIYLQIELGSTATTYEPYHEQTVTLPYTLNAIPVSSGGNVTIGGQEYVSDYFDVERGKLVRMCKRRKLFEMSIQDWGTGDNGARKDWYVDVEKYDYAAYTKRIIPCLFSSLMKKENQMKYPYFTYETIGNNGWQGYSRLSIYVSKEYDTLEKLKEYIGADAEVVYQLKTPEETDLTPEEITALKALATYYPTTNISVNSEQLDGYTVFNYPISMENGWNYVKQQIGDTRDYIYDMDARAQDTDLQAAEAYVNSEYAVALTELEV